MFWDMQEKMEVWCLLKRRRAGSSGNNSQNDTVQAFSQPMCHSSGEQEKGSLFFIMQAFQKPQLKTYILSSSLTPNYTKPEVLPFGKADFGVIQTPQQRVRNSQKKKKNLTAQKGDRGASKQKESREKSKCWVHSAETITRSQNSSKKILKILVNSFLKSLFQQVAATTTKASNTDYPQEPRE